MHYRVKHRCFKLLHYVVIICTRLFTFASSIRQKVLVVVIAAAAAISVAIAAEYRPYLAALLRYSDLLSENRKFFPPSSHSDPLRIYGKLYGS